MSSASVILGNNFLNMYHGIMLPSLPVSILNGIVILLLPVHISNLVVSINWLLFLYTELILTISISSLLYSWDISCSITLTTLLLLLQQTFLKCPTLLHSVHILPYAGQCLSWCVSPQDLYGCHCVVWFTGALALSSFVFFDIFTLSNFLDSVNVFNTAVWALALLPSWPMPTHFHMLCGHCFQWPLILLWFPLACTCHLDQEWTALWTAYPPLGNYTPLLLHAFSPSTPLYFCHHINIIFWIVET